MEKEIPHIVISYPNYLPEALGKEFQKDFEYQNLDLKIDAHEPQVYASLEWAIPGLLTAYLFKPYFESFLSEMGKDHYDLLKGKLKKFVKKFRDAPVTTHVSEGATKKLSSDNTQSKAVSVNIQLKHRQILKVMFDTEVEMTRCLSILDRIMDKVLEHYEGFPNDALSKEVFELNEKPYNHIYAVMNKETESWNLYSMEKIIAEKREKQLKKEKKK